MRFQKTTEYAIRVMVFLAANEEAVFSASQLHKMLNIPYKYLGRLMNHLNRAGFAEVRHGKNGGYRINPSRQPIYLYQIIGLVEGLENYDRCVLGFENCSDEHPCPMHHVWLKFKGDLREMIFNTTLTDLEKPAEVTR
jgi:Rrf2 family iron-sulfur cluster assembly transcriptional regulator